MDAADAALSVFDQVIADAPTLLGRSKALPSCVACNRPLPTKARRAPPPPRTTASQNTTAPERDPPEGVEKLLASKGPDIPRPLSAPPGGRVKEAPEATKMSMTASERALRILHAHLPQPNAYGPAEVDANSTNSTATGSVSVPSAKLDHADRVVAHRVGDNTAAFLQQRARYDAEVARSDMNQLARQQAHQNAGALDPNNAPPHHRGFRATKRLPTKRPQSAPRSGRALP